MKKRILSVVCSIAFAMFSMPFSSMCIIQANAAVFKGSGTADDPYQISSANDLIKLSNLVNDEGTTEEYGYAYYIQTADIDLNNELFTPIATYYGDDGVTGNKKLFGGNYNGNYHKISNLYIDYDNSYTGLFGIIGGYKSENKECAVKNLSVSGNVQSELTAVGGIAGEVRYGAIIENCDFTGIVSGDGTVGGIVGQSYCGGNISSCYANCEVVAVGEDKSAGGIVGVVQAGNTTITGSNDPVIKNNYFAGTLSAVHMGGICGNSILKTERENTIITFLNNYYLNTSCDLGVGSNNAKGCTKLVSVALKACADMLGAPFVDNDEDEFNDGYPIFEWQSTPYQFKGSGTEEDPYQISNKDELKTMRDLINSTYYNSIYGHANYIQIADIDLDNESWEPIGLGRDGEDGQGAYNYKNRMFYAKYNGNKHIIKNLNVSGEWINAGLFSYIRGENAGINDLVVYGNIATSNGYSVGGIVGEVQYGSELKNCAFIGDVTANEEASYVGGIIGQIWAADDVINCYHNGNVTGGKFAGGIAGQVAFGTSNIDGQSSNIMNCFQVNGKISGIEYSGAVIGNCMYANGIQNTITVYNCYATSDCGANELSQNATSDNTMLLPKSLLKKVAEDLGDAYVDNSDKSLNDGYPVFTWQANNTMVSGDVNEDGEFNVADVILIQKWLLAVPDTHLPNWKAADLCEDDRLDVFDLCMMKRELIQNG